MEIKYIGIVGLGTTGRAIAARTDCYGVNVTVYDSCASKIAAAVETGARPARIPADAAELADAVVVTMPDESAAEEVLFDLGGVGETLRAGGYVLDASTTGHAFSCDATARLAKFGIHRLELAFDPRAARRRTGRARVLVGGSPDDVAAMDSLLHLLADDVVHVGPVGSVAALRQSSAGVPATRSAVMQAMSAVGPVPALT